MLELVVQFCSADCLLHFKKKRFIILSCIYYFYNLCSSPWASMPETKAAWCLGVPFLRGDDVGERYIALACRPLSGLLVLQKTQMSEDFHHLLIFLCFASMR